MALRISVYFREVDSFNAVHLELIKLAARLQEVSAAHGLEVSPGHSIGLPAGWPAADLVWQKSGRYLWLEIRQRAANMPAELYLPAATVFGAVSAGDESDPLAEKELCCTICLGSFSQGDSIRVTECMHRYHADCLEQWVRHSFCCPMCKRDMRIKIS